MSATGTIANRAATTPALRLLLLACALASMAWQLIGPSSTTISREASLLIVLAAVTSAVAALATIAAPPSNTRLWLAVSVGSLAWSFSHPARLDDSIVRASLMSGAYLCMAAAFSLAVIVVLGITGSREGIAKLLLDMVPPVIAVAAATWIFIIGPYVLDAASSRSAQVIATVHGVGSASLLVLSGAAMFTRRRSAVSLDRQLLVAGVSAVAIADALRIHQLVSELGLSMTVANLLFAAGFALLLAGAVASRSRRSRRDTEEDRAAGSWQTMVPNLSLVAMLLLAGGQAIYGEPVRGGLIVAIGSSLIMLGLALARQSIVLRRDLHLRSEIGELSDRIDGLMLQVGRDPLTGLLNHRAVHERLDHELASGRVSGEPVAVVLIDVDNFKTVNDTLGHQAGDRVLRAIAGILSAACRGTDVAARYAGDEFMLLLPGLDENHAGSVCGRIADEVRRVNRDLALGGHVTVSLSVGVAVTHRCLRSVSQTVAIADAAMYDAKETGKDQIVVVNADTLVIADLTDGRRQVDAMVEASRAFIDPAAQLNRRKAG